MEKLNLEDTKKKITKKDMIITYYKQMTNELNNKITNKEKLKILPNIDDTEFNFLDIITLINEVDEYNISDTIELICDYKKIELTSLEYEILTPLFMDFIIKSKKQLN